MGAQEVRAPVARGPARTAGGNATATRSLWWTIALHLLPGLAFGAFILAAVPVLDNYDIDPLFALFGGIALVPVPIELGYLAVQAHRTTGSWSPLAAVAYRKRNALGAELRQAMILAGWFIALLVVSIAVLDRLIAEHVFGWVPHQILQFASMEGEVPVGLQLAAVIVIAFVCNGFLGPITEEMYFRGHLLPRLERLGNKAPVLNTALFALYHVWSPWRWPVIFLGFLPTAVRVRRTQSVRLGVFVHLLINNVFLVLLVVGLMSG
jgi:membrane protease YdiL (CAAX protease family)